MLVVIVMILEGSGIVASKCRDDEWIIYIFYKKEVKWGTFIIVIYYAH